MLNKKLVKVVLIIFMIISSLTICQTGVKAAGEITGWQLNGTTWCYIDTYGNKTTGWIRWRGNYYYLDSNGVMATGWKSIQGKWYYMKPGSGAMATGWLSYGGKWYYLDLNNGAMATEMIQSGGKWYWLNSGGDMATGWKSSGWDWYYLNPATGERVTGWLKSGGSWYYLRPESGYMATGWVRTVGSWYYMNPNGSMAYNTTIDGRYLGYNGAWNSAGNGAWQAIKIPCWHSDGGYWYYYNPMRGYEKGWVFDGGKWYYLNPVSAEMLTGWVLDGGKWYYLYADGSMAYNTTIDGFYLGGSGAWQTNIPAENYMITLGSTEDDVLSAMREPTNIESSNSLVKYYYNDSIIYFLDSGNGMMVIGWDNEDNNLQVTIGAKSSNAFFNLGSTMDEVAQVMGTPKNFDPYYYLGSGRWTYWEYDDGSIVDFDGNFKVNGWYNKGSLKVNLGNKDATAPSIKLGSTLQDVVKVMGTPTTLQSNTDTKVAYLYYGNTYITLGRDETVSGWLKKDIYDINLGDKDPSAPTIAVGSTLEDVIRAMGSPDEVTASSFNDKPYSLKYGTSYIHMDDRTGMVQSWTNNGNLKLAEAN